MALMAPSDDNWEFLDQLEREIRDAVLGNVGTLESFRLRPKDASLIAKESDPYF